MNEINILRRCEHKHIIKLHEVYESTHFLYLVQSFLKGGELFETILKRGSFGEKDTQIIMA
jgi:serine/threonine protein kinase